MVGSSTSISSLLGIYSFKAAARYGMPFSSATFYANFDIGQAVIFITTLLVGLMVTSRCFITLGRFHITVFARLGASLFNSLLAFIFVGSYLNPNLIILNILQSKQEPIV
ncbi:hypothetical protein SLE2022_210590 [Rubroshorea leprosula]